MEFNVETLKRDVAEHLENSDFAIFHTVPHGFDRNTSVYWDAESYPDFRMFLDVARSAGVRIVCFGTEELDEDSLDLIEEEIETGGFAREEQREYTSRLRQLRAYQGMISVIELAFQQDGRTYVYQVRPPWYDDYITLEDEVMSGSAEDMDDDDSLGGYFSKN